MTTCDGDVRISEANRGDPPAATGGGVERGMGCAPFRGPDWYLLGRQLLPGEPARVRQARLFTETALRTSHELWAGLPSVADEQVEIAVLLASELVSNAIQHTRSGYPGGLVRLEVWRCAHHLVVEARDEGPRPGVRPSVPTVRHPTLDLTHGRGLALVASLATAWNVLRTGPGHAVWFELATTPVDVT